MPGQLREPVHERGVHASQAVREVPRRQRQGVDPDLMLREYEPHADALSRWVDAPDRRGYCWDLIETREPIGH